MPETKVAGKQIGQWTKTVKLARTPTSSKGERGDECEYGTEQKGPLHIEFEEVSKLFDIIKAVFGEYQICAIWIQSGENSVKRIKKKL